MAENSKIEWTDHTFNPWRGCTKVSAGCDHCYAEALGKRNPVVLGEWGDDGVRVIAKEGYWTLPRKWNRQAAKGVRRRVFCLSLGDVFELRAELAEPRARMFREIDACQNLDWLLLTKRPENVARLWHSRTYVDAAGNEWGRSEPCGLRFVRKNVWLGASVENQAAIHRVEHLATCRDLTNVLFLSFEPLLGPLDISRWVDQIDWVIVGGESGRGARPMHPDWARSIRDECDAAGVPFFFKQWGEHDEHGKRVGKKAAGRLLDGREWNEVPR